MEGHLGKRGDTGSSGLEENAHGGSSKEEEKEEESLLKEERVDD